MSDNELSARLNMADAKFSFMERAKSYHPQWMAPEALGKSPKNINTKAADMWSFAVLLWELSTREIPFPDLSPMEAGMKVSLSKFFLYSIQISELFGRARLEKNKKLFSNYTHYVL